MHKKTTLAGMLIMLAAALLLAACTGSPAPAAPTGDANAVYTQAAATVSTGLTQTAEKNPAPTATVEPPTSTPTNTNVPPTPTVEQPGPNSQTTATPTATQPAGTNPKTNATPTPTKAGVTPVPTATKAAGPAPAVADKAEWVSQSPVDKTKIQKSATFTMTYVLKNTGKTTWNKNYALRFFAGNQMDSPNDTNLLRDVAPGESVEITFKMIAPDTAGATNSVWVMANEQGINFYSVNLSLDITD